MTNREFRRRTVEGWLTVPVVVLLAGCSTGEGDMHAATLEDFTTRYAAAWSTGDPASVAAFYAEDGSLTVNDGEPALGREGVTEVARGFMTTFPDLVVYLDSLVVRDEAVEFHWTFTGTNTAPGGTGNAVRISGYEEWTLGGDGLIARSLGHYDQAEYDRQLEFGVDGP